MILVEVCRGRITVARCQEPGKRRVLNLVLVLIVTVMSSSKHFGTERRIPKNYTKKLLRDITLR